MIHPKFLVVTPARNESKYLPLTIRSMVSQTVKPSAWVIVNDGSTDGTAQLIDDASSLYPWIRPLHLSARGQEQERGLRAIEAKEIVAFHKGLESVSTLEGCDFIVKLDADLGFSATYFEKCLRHFDADPTLGIAGGTVVNMGPAGKETETHPLFHVRGATKIYRRSCWDAMGGIPAVAGWDTMDEVKANKLGWKTRTLGDVELAHYRPTGAANGAWKNALKNGMWSYQIGYHPAFILLRSARQLLRRPYLTGSVALVYGYCKAAMGDTARPDPELAEYVRQQQINRLLGRPTIWQ